jgi:2-(1,2-epoxy-1,2-dihydrophenyl)acetyl-CoA isomerase
VSSDAFQFVRLQVAAGVGTLTLNRPDRLNAFEAVMREEMVAGAQSLVRDPAVRAIVVTGAGRAFCSGADVRYMHDCVHQGRHADAMRLLEAGNEMVRVLRGTAKPVLGSLNGPAVGGGAGIALACDLRIASDQASLGFVFHKLGLHPDIGSTHFLARQVGTARALELFWSGRLVPAGECLALGLVNKVVPAAELESATAEWAAWLAGLPAPAVGLSKAAVYAGESRDFSTMLDLERANQLACFQSRDAAEGLAAYLGRRPPRFATE